MIRRLTIRRRSLLASGAAMFATGALGLAPGHAQQKRVRYMWWGGQDRSRRTFALLDLYQKRMPGLEMAGETTGWGDYWTRLATQIAGRNAPDIMEMDYRYIFEYARRGALLPLDKYFPDTLKIADYGKDNIDAGRVDGKLYGINLGVTAAAMIVNGVAWEEVGIPAPMQDTSWEEFAANCAKLTKTTKRKNYHGTSDGSGYAAAFECWIRQRGKAVFAADGKLGFDAEDVGDWFALWAGMRESGACVTPDQQALDTSDIETKMVTVGSASISFGWSNQLVGYQAVNKDKLMLMSYPVLTNGKPGQYLKPSQFQSISAQSQSPDQAVAFSSFAVADVEGAKVLGLERGVPCSPAIRAALAPEAGEADRAIIVYIGGLGPVAGTLPPPPPPGAGEIETVLRKTSEQIAFGSATPKQGGQTFVEQAKAILSRG
jgi:multiple sugar transport system substrate-binding protein